MDIKVFIAGIIQGSDRGRGIYSQDYRTKIKTILTKFLPDAKIFCPFENHPNSIDYDDKLGKKVFLELMEKASQTDVLIAFLPQASLGTAIEIWQAYQAGKIIFTISPMTENWVIKFLSNRNFLSLEEFENFVSSGQFETIVKSYESQKPKTTSP